MKLSAIYSLGLLILAGCASYPEAVRVDEGTPLVDYQAAVQQGAQQGLARWSGVIAKVQNNSQDTRLEIVFFPSSNNGRPQVSDETAGRFVAYVPKFLDPMVYQQGKAVTVLGQLAQPEAGQVDKYRYVYPVIQQAVVHLWPKQQEHTRVEVEPWPLWRTPYPYWGYGPAVRIRTTIPTGETPAQGPAHVQSSKQGQQQR